MTSSDQSPTSPGATDPRVEAIRGTDAGAAPDEWGEWSTTPDMWAEKVLAAADAVDPLRQPGMICVNADQGHGVICVDTNNEAVMIRVALAYCPANGDCGYHADCEAEARAMLAALQGEQP